MKASIGIVFARAGHPVTMTRIAAERRTGLAADQLEARAEWRDRRLIALMAHKRGAPDK